MFNISVKVFFLSDWYFIFYLCWNSHCVHPFSWVWSAFSWPLCCTLYQVDCFSSFSLVFSRVLPCSFVGTYPSNFSFCLTLCICFYLLGGSDTSLGLEVGPYVDVLWGPEAWSHPHPPATRARCFREHLWGLHMSSCCGIFTAVDTLVGGACLWSRWQWSPAKKQGSTELWVVHGPWH